METFLSLVESLSSDEDKNLLVKDWLKALESALQQLKEEIDHRRRFHYDELRSVKDKVDSIIADRDELEKTVDCLIKENESLKLAFKAAGLAALLGCGCGAIALKSNSKA